jgi:hypothetical protein
LIALVQCLMPVANIYNVVRRQDLYMTAIVLGMGAYAGSLWWLARDGVSLTSFPQAMLIGRIVFAVACYTMMIVISRNRR